MDQEEKEARQQMAETRSSLTDKLETLEHEVTDMMQGATTAMSDTVTSVQEAVASSMAAARETVHDTVEAVQHAFDFKRQIRRHPWGMVVGAVMAGYLLGRLLSRPYA